MIWDSSREGYELQGPGFDGYMKVAHDHLLDFDVHL
jgi:hypothetical protein